MTETEPTLESTPPPRGARQQRVVVVLWRLLAIAAFALGVVGALLPVLPTVPFLLLSAWAASKGWPEFERWLLAHRVLGPPIERWRARGAITRRTKWLASTTMLVSVVALQFFASIALWVRVAVPLFLLGMAIWLWLRPED